MSKKDEKIEYLESEVQRLREKLYAVITENDRLTLTYEPYEPPKYPKCGSVSFDFWPLSEWVRFSVSRWNPGRYAQIIVGPLRVDWFEG